MPNRLINTPSPFTPFTPFIFNQLFIITHFSPAGVMELFSGWPLKTTANLFRTKTGNRFKGRPKKHPLNPPRPWLSFGPSCRANAGFYFNRGFTLAKFTWLGFRKEYSDLLFPQKVSDPGNPEILMIERKLRVGVIPLEFTGMVWVGVCGECALNPSVKE